MASDTADLFRVGWWGFMKGAIFPLALSCLILTGLDVWQMEHAFPHDYLTTTGWFRLQPLGQTLTYRTNGSFTASFSNIVGTAIIVNRLVVSETLMRAACDDLNVNGVSYASGRGNVTVRAGNTFEISAHCPSKPVDDRYDLEIAIDYASVTGGITTYRNETGHIRGPVES